MTALIIKPVTTIEECRHIENLHLKIWRTEPIDIVPDHLLITITKNSGVVLLALENDEPVGFSYSFLAQAPDGQLKYCSHQTGVLPHLQSRNVGYQIKLAQREAVLAQGISLITWTFDPLLSLNARLNLGKLGAVSQTYIEKLYGAMRSGINAKLDSDRLEVRWRLNSPHVIEKLHGSPPPIQIQPQQIINAATKNRANSLIPSDTLSSFQCPIHYVQLPINIQALKMADLGLAVAWQRQIRHLFQTAFSIGYIVSDFIWQRGDEHSYYQFTKETL